MTAFFLRCHLLCCCVMFRFSHLLNWNVLNWFMTYFEQVIFFVKGLKTGVYFTKNATRLVSSLTHKHFAILFTYFKIEIWQKLLRLVLLLLPSILDHVTWCQQMKMLKWQQKNYLDKKSVAMYRNIIRRPGPYLLFWSDFLSQCDSTSFEEFCTHLFFSKIFES